MSRKSRPSKHRKRAITNPLPVDKHLNLIEREMVQGNYAEIVANCERLLNYLPQRAPQRLDVLTHLGTAHAIGTLWTWDFASP